MRLKEGHKEKDILKAATSVFARVGYGQAKIADIAKIANIATGSVYLYFKNKEEILLLLLFRLWNEIYEGSIDIVGKNLSPPESLDLILEHAMNVLFRDLNMAQIYGNEQNLWVVRKKGNFRLKYQHFLDLLAQLFESGIQNGDFNDRVKPDYAIGFVIGGIRNLVHKWSLEKNSTDLAELRANILTLVQNTLIP